MMKWMMEGKEGQLKMLRTRQCAKGIYGGFRSSSVANLAAYEMPYHQLQRRTFKFPLFQSNKLEVPSLKSDGLESEYEIHGMKIKDPYFKLSSDVVECDRYIENETKYFDEYYDSKKKELKWIKNELKELQQNYPFKNYYKYNDKLTLTHIEPTFNYVYFSFNHDEYNARLPIQDVNLDTIYTETFYRSICSSFERKYLTKMSLHSRILSAEYSGLELIHNKQTTYGDLEKYLKKNSKKYGNDGRISYNILNQKTSYCQQYTLTIVEVNTKNIIVLKKNNKVLHVIDDIPNVANIDIDSTENHFSFLFTVTDEKHRTNKIYHRVYTDSDFTAFRDSLLYEESDERFFIDIGRTKNDCYSYLSINSKNTTEVYLLVPSKQGDDQPYRLHCIQRRKEGIQFFFEYHKETDTFFLVSNQDADSDLDIYRVSGSELLKGEDYEKVLLLKHLPGQAVHEIDIFENYLITYIVDASIPKLLKYDIRKNNFEQLSIPEDTHYIEVCANLDYSGSLYHIKCHSLMFKDPHLVTYNLEDNSMIDVFGAMTGRKESNIVCEAINTNDGIPVKILYDKTLLNGTNKCFIIGYGAYGTHLLEELQIAENTLFYFYREYFLKRGYIFVFAHVRGGKENGAHWYKQGIKENKINSMMDVKSVMDYLVNTRQLTTYGSFIGRGISAGGLLMMSTHLLFQNHFNTLVLKVPFLDILTIMLDNSLPMTEHEYDEYGDPKTDIEIAKQMARYSPYQLLLNGKVAPHLYMTGSIDDFKCPLWNIAKLMALIRRNSALDMQHKKINLLRVHDYGHMDEVCTKTFHDDVAKEVLFIEDSFSKN